jgi:hypothetical protein
MFVKMLCFTNVFRRKTIQSLTSVIIRNELSKDLVFDKRIFNSEDNKIHLKHTSLSIFLLQHDRTRFNDITTRTRNIMTVHDTIVSRHEDVLSSQLL